MLKIGIIGAGMAWEKLHYPAYMRLKDKYEITCVCDRDISKAKRAALTLGIGMDKIYDDVKKMLKEGDMSAVDIMVPIQENYEITKEAIAAKKHIIAEKPFASTEDGAAELIQSGKKLKIMVAENYRYDIENGIIKQLIKDKRIGNVAYFIDNNVTEFTKEMLKNNNFASAEWRKHPVFKGGIFLDSAVHHMARLRFLFGDPLTICASGRPSKADFCPYSCVNALLTFKDHITGHYSFFNIGKETQAPLTGLRIFGTHGEIYLEERKCGFVNLSLKTGEHEVIPYTPEEGYYNELLNFYEAVVDNAPIVSTPEKEIGDIRMVYDILDSIDTNSEEK